MIFWISGGDIRSLNKNDADIILKMHDNAFSYSNLPHPTISELKKKKGWVVVKNSDIAGFLIYTDFTSPSDDKKWFLLDMIGTKLIFTSFSTRLTSRFT